MGKFDAAGAPGRGQARSPRRSSGCWRRSSRIDGDRRDRRHLRRRRAAQAVAVRAEPGVRGQGARQAANPHLAIEALRDVARPRRSAAATRNNLVRQRAFSERIAELMSSYTNQQLTSAEVIAELIAMAKEVAAEGNRGQALHAAAVRRRTGLLRRGRARTSRPSSCRARTCSPRSRANWSR